MAITGKVKTLFEDKERTQAIFPRTVFSAVTNEDGESMDELLVSAVCIGEDLNDTQPLPVDADTLGGQSPDYYAKASEVSKLTTEEMTITTNSAGLCALNITALNLLQVQNAGSVNRICLPFYNSGWWIRVIDAVSGNIVASERMAIRIIYYN